MRAMERREAWSEVYAARVDMFNAGGWEYLLPYTPGARWVCLDDGSGSAAALLAGHFAEVAVVPADPARRSAVAERLELLDVPNVRFVAGLAEAAGSKGFDGFVLHDLSGAIDRDTVRGSVEAAGRALGPEGSLYVAVRNRSGYARLRGGLKGILNGAGPWFRPADFASSLRPGRSLAVHPLLCEPAGRLIEVIPASGYVSAQNPSLRGERLRRTLLGPRAAPLLAPGFALLARGTPRYPSLLEQAIAGLERRCSAEAGTFAMRRYHCLRGGKVVVSAGKPGDASERFILIFARSLISIERRRREFALLEALGRLPPALASRIPRPEYEEAAGGARVFVMREFAGVTLDAAVPALDGATAGGADFITRLHVATRKSARITADRFEPLCGAMFDTATRRYPAIVAQLSSLRSCVRDSLARFELPLVWMHGDYKVENLVVDARTGELSGVIDWELSEPESLPLLDLWYLLLYNRQIRTGKRFYQTVRDLLSDDRLLPAEAALCERYVREVGVPRDAIASLAAMAMVHHCAHRLYFDNSDVETMKLIGEDLNEARRRIEGGAGGEAA